MTSHSKSRILAFTLLLVVGFSSVESSADERQPLLRYLGVGWGTGYHSYNPRSAVHAAHGFCCTDRYSRPANCGCVDCGGSQSGAGYGGYVNQQGYGSGQIYGSPMNQGMPLYAPQNLQPAQQRLSPAKEKLPSLNNESLPSLKGPPSNSGSKQNPFGVTSNSRLNYAPAPTRTWSQQPVQIQPRYRSAQQIQRVPRPSNHQVAPANYNRVQLPANLDYQVYRPQHFSNDPRQQIRGNYNYVPTNHSAANYRALRYTGQGNEVQRGSTQSRVMNQNRYPNVGYSNVYRGTR